MPTRTFLFVDQVGSTEQLTRLGDLAAQEVRRALFDLLRQANEAAGGHEVDFTGDGLFCAFDGAVEAVDAAIDMQQLAWSFSRRRPGDAELAVRIGLNTGEPLESENSGYFGTAVVVAARLCACADAGQVLVSDVVRALVEPRGTRRFDPVGPLDLKGVPTPVTCFSADWSPDVRHPGLPPELVVPGEPPFVGRVAELAAVERAWRSVCAGARRLVLVSGDSGIGVSRLLAEAARRTTVDGAAVWFGAGSGTQQQLAPWAGAFGSWASAIPRAELRLCVGDRGTELVRLLPELSTLLPRLRVPTSVEAASSTFLVADALDDLIVRYSVHEPLVVVLDRLHEADPDTLSVVRRLVESRRAGRLLVLAGYEPSAVGTPHVLSALQGIAELTDLRLKGLTEPEIARMVEDIIGESPPPAGLHAIARESEGSPSFVVRMASALKERRITMHIEQAVHRSDELRMDLRLQREEISLGLRQLDQLRTSQPTPAAEVEPDGTPPASVANPFKGLVAFQQRDSADFHGRELLVAELVARLATSRFLAVIGPSGSGKSSVVRAGLLPALARGALPGSETWVPVLMTPGRDPLESLARALAELDPAAAAQEFDIVSRLTVSGLGVVANRLARGVPVVLVVDQLEEVWTAASQTGSDFLDLLQACAADPQGQVVVVLTLRADYYGRLADHARLSVAVADSQVVVGPMRPSELRAAIERPAAAAGLSLEPGLTQSIIDDAAGEPGALPLVSTALWETWQRRRGRSLTLAGYAEAGGVRGAVARLADSAFDELSTAERDLAQRLFLRLASPGENGDDVARAVPYGELADDPSLGPVLERLAERRLVTLSAGRAQVAHEALLREWPRLRAWLDADRDGRRVHLQIAAAATEWVDSRRDPGALMRGVRLAVATDLHAAQPSRLSATERAFLEASQQERLRELALARRTARRFQLLTVGLVLLLAGALVASGLALAQNRSATSRSNEADARGLAARAASLAPSALDTALLLAVEGYRRAPSLDTEGGLLEALGQASHVRSFRQGLPPGVLGAVITPDLRTVVVLDDKGVLHTVDTSTWRSREPSTAVSLMGTTLSGTGLVLDPTGRRVAFVMSDRVRSVDLSTGSVVADIWFPSSVDLGITADGSSVFVHDKAAKAVRLVDITTGAERARVPFSVGPDPANDADSTVGDVSPVAHVLALAPFATTPVLQQFRFDGSPLGPPVHLDLPAGATSVSYSPDGAQVVVVAGSAAMVLNSFDLTPVGPPVHLSGTQAGGVTFSPDGVRVAVTNDDGSVTVLSRKDGSVESTLRGQSGFTSAVFLDDRRVLAVGVRGWLEYDLRGGSAIARGLTDQGFFDLGVRPPADTVLTVTDEGLEELNIPGAGRTVDWALPARWFAQSLTVSADGRRAAVQRGSQTRDGALESMIDIVDLPSRRTLASVAVDGTDQRDRSSDFLEFSPDHQRLAVGTSSGKFTILDGGTGRTVVPLRVLESVPWWLDAIAWPSDDVVLLGGQDGVLYRVSATTGEVVKALHVSGASPLTDAAMVPGTAMVALSTQNGDVVFADSVTMTEVGPRLNGSGAQLTSVAVSPDGGQVATTSHAGDIRLWDRRTGRAIGPPLPAHTGYGVGVAYGSDGRRLWTAGYDRQVLEWDLRPASWVARACEIAHRNLSRDEWARYLPGRPYRATCPAYPAS